MDKEKETYGAAIERGKIAEKKAGPLYKVESYTRDGVKTRWMEAINQYVREYEGDPPQENKYEYAVGDEVYYFMFDDGRGMILGKMIRQE